MPDAACPCCLSDMPAGAKTRVRGLHCGRTMRAHLAAMGITPGTELRICPECGKNQGGKRVIVRDAALVLDEGIVKIIECSPPEQMPAMPAACDCRPLCGKTDGHAHGQRK